MAVTIEGSTQEEKNMEISEEEKDSSLVRLKELLIDDGECKFNHVSRRRNKREDS